MTGQVSVSQWLPPHKCCSRTTNAALLSRRKKQRWVEGIAVVVVVERKLMLPVRGAPGIIEVQYDHGRSLGATDDKGFGKMLGQTVMPFFDTLFSIRERLGPKARSLPSSCGARPTAGLNIGPYIARSMADLLEVIANTLGLTVFELFDRVREQPVRE